ncbi:MAG: hypothetical protein ABH825_00845, partial [Candidatus Omnitrophota bacterium]
EDDACIIEWHGPEIELPVDLLIPDRARNVVVAKRLTTSGKITRHSTDSVLSLYTRANGSSEEKAKTDRILGRFRFLHGDRLGGAPVRFELDAGAKRIVKRSFRAYVMGFFGLGDEMVIKGEVGQMLSCICQGILVGALLYPRELMFQNGLGILHDITFWWTIINVPFSLVMQLKSYEGFVRKNREENAQGVLGERRHVHPEKNVFLKRVNIKKRYLWGSIFVLLVGVLRLLISEELFKYIWGDFAGPAHVATAVVAVAVFLFFLMNFLSIIHSGIVGNSWEQLFLKMREGEGEKAGLRRDYRRVFIAAHILGTALNLTFLWGTMGIYRWNHWAGFFMSVLATGVLVAIQFFLPRFGQEYGTFMRINCKSYTLDYTDAEGRSYYKISEGLWLRRKDGARAERYPIGRLEPNMRLHLSKHNTIITMGDGKVIIEKYGSEEKGEKSVTEIAIPDAGTSTPVEDTGIVMERDRDGSIWLRAPPDEFVPINDPDGKSLVIPDPGKHVDVVYDPRKVAVKTRDKSLALRRFINFIRPNDVGSCVRLECREIPHKASQKVKRPGPIFMDIFYYDGTLEVPVQDESGPDGTRVKVRGIEHLKPELGAVHREYPLKYFVHIMGRNLDKILFLAVTSLLFSGLIYYIVAYNQGILVNFSLYLEQALKYWSFTFKNMFSDSGTLARMAGSVGVLDRLFHFVMFHRINVVYAAMIAIWPIFVFYKFTMYFRAKRGLIRDESLVFGGPGTEIRKKSSSRVKEMRVQEIDRDNVRRGLLNEADYDLSDLGLDMTTLHARSLMDTDRFPRGVSLKRYLLYKSGKGGGGSPSAGRKKAIAVVEVIRRGERALIECYSSKCRSMTRTGEFEIPVEDMISPDLNEVFVNRIHVTWKRDMENSMEEALPNFKMRDIMETDPRWDYLTATLAGLSAVKGAYSGMDQLHTDLEVRRGSVKDYVYFRRDLPTISEQRDDYFRVLSKSHSFKMDDIAAYLYNTVCGLFMGGAAYSILQFAAQELRVLALANILTQLFVPICTAVVCIIILEKTASIEHGESHAKAMESLRGHSRYGKLLTTMYRLKKLFIA